VQRRIKRWRKTLFSRKNDVQAVGNGGRRRIKIRLHQCDIRRSWKSNRWNPTSLSYHGCCLSYARSLVVHISARRWLKAHKTLVRPNNIRISQGSAAARLRCGWNFNNSFIAHCPQSVIVKELLKSVNIWRRYGQKFGSTFLWTTARINSQPVYIH